LALVIVYLYRSSDYLNFIKDTHERG
jgi:hypothetical protein